MCDSSHGACDAACLDLLSMEWVLQVVDEIDDAIGVLRHGWLGIRAQIGVLLAAMLAAAAATGTAGATLRTRSSKVRARP